jgi:hypothetical protein
MSEIVFLINIFFCRYSRNQDFLSTEDLTLFLEAEQGVIFFFVLNDLIDCFLLKMSKITQEKCAELIQEFEPSTEAKLLGHLGIDGKFNRYLKQ